MPLQIRCLVIECRLALLSLLCLHRFAFIAATSHCSALHCVTKLFIASYAGKRQWKDTKRLGDNQTQLREDSEYAANGWV